MLYNPKEKMNKLMEIVHELEKDTGWQNICVMSSEVTFKRNGEWCSFQGDRIEVNK